MISPKDLNPNGFPMTNEISRNLDVLHERLCELIFEVPTSVMPEWGVSSGLRSQALQNKLIEQGKTNAHKSNHLIGKAVDIFDPGEKLAKWCLDNLSILERIGLWCEDFRYTKGWVHFQTCPPPSGVRIFKP